MTEPSDFTNPSPDHSPRLCAQCGAVLAEDGASSLCPACLLQVGFETQNGELGQPGDSSAAYQPTFLPPSVDELAPHFPQLEIVEVVGHGGMGVVYKARQIELDRLVALKILRPNVSSEKGFAERFQREARALAKLNHPNIITVYDFGRKDSLYYFIMEYVEGTNLRHLERSGNLSPREALQVVPQVCAALQYAHDNGIVHRDIKPENILIARDGSVRIADFGLAKLAGVTDDAPLTGTWQVMGTPHYMAPEQFEKPATVDHRADIYSLGVVIYELLTGELPIGRFRLPSEKVRVDVRLDEVVLRSLDKEPDRRYQRVTDVATAVEDASSDTPGSATLAELRARVDQTGQQAKEFLRKAAGQVREHATTLKSSASGWEPVLRKIHGWLGDRHRGLGLLLMIVGVAELLTAAVFLPDTRSGERLIAQMFGGAFGALTIWFGRELRRGRITKKHRWAGLICLLPWPLSGEVINLFRLLLMPLALIASLHQRAMSNIDNPPEADVVDAAFRFLRRAREVLNRRLLTFTLLGIIGWCVLTSIVFGAVHLLWFESDVPSRCLITDTSANRVEPVSDERIQLFFFASDNVRSRGIDFDTLDPARTQLTLIGSSRQGHAELQINFLDRTATLRDRSGIVAEDLPIRRTAVESWMSRFARDVNSAETQREIEHLTDVVGVMYTTQGLTRRLSPLVEQWYPTAAPQIREIQSNRTLMAGKIIPVGRLLDPSLFRNTTTDSRVTWHVIADPVFVYIYLLIMFVVWLFGMVRVVRILFRELWVPAMNDSSTELSGSASSAEATSEVEVRSRVAQRWNRCCVSLILTSLISMFLVASLASWSGLFHLRSSVYFDRFSLHIPVWVIEPALIVLTFIGTVIAASALFARPVLRFAGRSFGFLSGTLAMATFPISLLTWPSGLAALIVLTDPSAPQLFASQRRSTESSITE
ncbi:MAG: serine/threonine protein kinase [Planctomycetaceae bacterium]|nr:serine/threonine protein kinase [Planctomycetaceae bacterium]